MLGVVARETLKAIFDKTVLIGHFPKELKYADVASVYLKKNPLK